MIEKITQLFFSAMSGACCALLLISTADAFDERLQSINKELDCVAGAINRNKEITWSDVCYTRSAEEQRLDVIEEELDAYEFEYEYGRQEQYQDSLEYLNNFMSDAQTSTTSYDSDDYEYEDTYADIGLPPQKYKYTREQYRESSRMIKTSLSVYGGYRIDNLDWTIAGDLQGANPNIFTEYEFKDVQTWQIRAKGNIIFNNMLVLDGNAAYGEIVDGDNQVSEYDGDDKTMLAVRTDNDTNEDNILDVAGGVGWRVKVPHNAALNELFEFNHLYLTVLLGYSHHEQNFSITDGVTVFDATSSPELGPFEGLDSSYNAEWKGPWIGLELEGQKDRISGLFRVEYHLADYYGWGQLNLRPEFQQPKSFEHTTDGNGWVMSLALAYQLTENFSLDFLGDLQLWNTKEGVDRLFLSNGTVEERQLNEVEWESYALMLGATLKFR